jgi:hypothetical protein
MHIARLFPETGKDVVDEFCVWPSQVRLPRAAQFRGKHHLSCLWATPDTWPGIIPTDSAEQIGATAIALLEELPAALLANSNLPTMNSTTSCKSWALAVRSLAVQLLLVSKPVAQVVIIAAQLDLGSVDLLEALHPGSKAEVVVVVSMESAALARLHHERLLQVAQPTATVMAVVVADSLRAQLPGNSRARVRTTVTAKVRARSNLPTVSFPFLH